MRDEVTGCEPARTEGGQGPAVPTLIDTGRWVLCELRTQREAR